MRSVHDLVTADAVAERAGILRALASAVLASQAHAVALVRSANHVVVLPEVGLYHRGDRLGRWCEAHLDEIFSDENLEAARPAWEADEGLLIGTTLARQAGCPKDLLYDENTDQERQVYTVDDIADLVNYANVPDGDEQLAIQVEAGLRAFWDLAAEATEDWQWPYSPADAEAMFEQWLVENLDALEPFGLHVKIAEPMPGRSGRQWTTSDRTGRLDLLVEVVKDGSTAAGPSDAPITLNFETGDLVVIELKAGPLTRPDVAQIQRYRAAAESEITNGRAVWGLLIGGGATASLYDALDAEADPKLLYLWMSQVGFTAARIQGRPS